MYHYDSMPLFAYSAGRWLSSVSARAFGVQLAAREIGQPLARPAGQVVLESYRAARRIPVVVMLSHDKSRCWRHGALTWKFCLVDLSCLCCRQPPTARI